MPRAGTKSALLGVIVTVALAGCGGGAKAAPIEPPQIMSDSTPFAYPLELWDNKISGQTLLLVRISELGAVDATRPCVPITSD